MSTAYTGGAQFLAWGDGPSGPWIKILLPDSDDLAPFRGMTAAKKAMAGQLLAVRIDEVDVLTGAEEAPPAGGKAPPSHDQGSVNTTPRTHPKKTPQKLSQYAALLCQKPEFQAFLTENYPDEMAADGVLPVEEAAAVAVRKLCAIESRSELDRNVEASAAFHRIRAEYHDWMESSGYDAS